MGLFKDLNTPHGHIIVCLFLIVLGAVFTKLQVPKGEDLIIGATGVLFMAMRQSQRVPDANAQIDKVTTIREETKVTPQEPKA
jgi:hypothetical protein